MSRRRAEPDVSVSPFAAAALLLAGVLLVGAKIWAAGEAAAVPAPNDLRHAPDGRLAVLVGRALYLGDPGAADAERIDLAALGAGERLADFDFFPNGDVLIWRDRGGGSWLEGVRAALGREIGAAEGSAAHVARCSPGTGECVPFVTGDGAPRPPYGVAIAPDGTVYMADTIEHRIVAYAPDGERRATFTDGLRFPNGLWLGDDRLWVANTVADEIVGIAIRPELGDEVERHPFDDGPRASGAGAHVTELHPTALASFGDQWWVVSIGERLVGAAVERLGADWQIGGSVELGAGAEPTAVLPHGEAVYVADAGRLRVARFAPDGSPRGELDWPALVTALADARGDRRAFTWTGHGAWTLFLALVAAGFVVGYRQGGTTAATVSGVPLSAIGLDPSDPRIRWLERGPGQPFRRWSLALLVAAFAGLGLALPLLTGWNATATQLAVAMLALAAIVWFIGAALLDARLGVHEGWLILGNGRHLVAGRGDAIDHNRYGLAIGEVAVPLGQPARPMFKRAALDEHVEPLLARASAISRAWMQLRILRSYPSMAAALGAFLLGTLAWLGYLGPIA